MKAFWHTIDMFEKLGTVFSTYVQKCRRYISFFDWMKQSNQLVVQQQEGTIMAELCQNHV